jgi:glycine oxidase
MSDVKGLRVVVAGAGAVGSVLALQLVRRGAEVVLADPAPAGDNASGVAAGMLAPLFETLLDPVSADLYPLLAEARDAWPAVLQGIAAAPALDRSGGMLKAASPEAAQRLLARAGDLGARARVIDAAEARRLAPGLAGEGAWLFTDEDWRLDPRATLGALHDAFARLGGRRLAAAAVAFDQGLVRFEGAPAWAADAVVLATGPQAGAWSQAAGQALVPIKGQILRFAGIGPGAGPVVRGEGVYVASGADGLVVGATMEEGRTDLAIDPEVVARLRAGAAALFPHLAQAPATASAGVRAATPDGAPLVGPSPQPGVLLARGARRNGWLLAPLIAQVILDHLLQRPPAAAGRAFDPARFH